MLRQINILYFCQATIIQIDMHDLVSDIAIPTLWRMADRLPVIYRVLSGTHTQASVLKCISHGNSCLQDKSDINIATHADQRRHLGHESSAHAAA